MPICSNARSPTVSVLMRSVTRTRASMALRGEMIVAHSPLLSPTRSASSGETSQNSSGCSSAKNGSVRVIAPEVYISVNR